MARAVKTEDGQEYPAEAYAYVPDPESPSTWKLRLWEDTEKKATVAQLGRAAAAFSPGGFRGQRVEIPEADQAAVKARIRAAYSRLGVSKEDIPKSVFAGSVVERDAKLFEAGDYPDKKLTVTEDDLDTIIGNFAEIPVKIEHIDTPFDGALGIVKAIWRKGKELFGRLVFSPEAWALAEKAGAKKLSVAISKDKTHLAEVSLTTSPRVASAAVFTFDAGEVGGILSDGDKGVVERFTALMTRLLEDTAQDGGDSTMTDVKKDEKVDPAAVPPVVPAVPAPVVDAAATAEITQLKTDMKEKDDRIKSLEFTNRVSEARRRLGALKQEGKLTPAAEPFAEVILLHGTEAVEFAEADKTVKATVADAFLKFLEAQPKVIDFSEVGKAGKPEDSELSAAEKVLLSKLGISDETYKKFKDR